jgi:hypothetical protein
MTPLRLGPVKRGDTWDLACTLRQTTGGAPVDLTGCAAALQVRHAQTDALVAAPDSIVIDPLVGGVTLTFLPATTAAIVPGTYYADLEITFADGRVRSTETLVLAVERDQTRP